MKVNRSIFVKLFMTVAAIPTVILLAFGNKVSNQNLDSSVVLTRNVQKDDIQDNTTFVSLDYQLPTFTLTKKISTPEFTRDYKNIIKFKDFQYNIIKNNAEYSQIISTREIYEEYYLPPHNAAKDAKDEWIKIFEILNAKALESYDEYVTPLIKSIISNNILLLNFRDMPQIEFTTHLDKKYTINSSNLFASKFSPTAVIAKSGIASKLNASLLESSSTFNYDIDALIVGAINAQIKEIVELYNSEFREASDFVSEKVTFVKNMVDRISGEKRADFENFLTIFYEKVNTGVIDKVKTTLTPAVRSSIDYFKNRRRNLSDFLVYFKTTNIEKNLKTITFTSDSDSTLADITLDSFNFRNSIKKFSQANDWLSNENSGPYFIAKKLESLINAFHVNDNKEKLFTNYYDDVNLVRNADTFKEPNLQNFEFSILDSLLNNKSAASPLIDLVNTVVPEKEYSSELEKLISQVKVDNASIDPEVLKKILEEIKAVSFATDLTNKYTTISIGATIGLIGALSTITMARGFVVKRKYGINFLKYARSRYLLFGISALAIAISPALIAIGILGVV